MPCLQGELCRCKALPRNASTRRIWSRSKNILGECIELWSHNEEGRRAWQTKAAEVQARELQFHDHEKGGEDKHTGFPWRVKFWFPVGCHVYGNKAAAIFICGVLVATLLVKPARPLSSLHLTTHHPSWATSMLSLQTKVFKEVID